MDVGGLQARREASVASQKVRLARGGRSSARAAPRDHAARGPSHHGCQATALPYVAVSRARAVPPSGLPHKLSTNTARQAPLPSADMTAAQAASSAGLPLAQSPALDPPCKRSGALPPALLWRCVLCVWVAGVPLGGDKNDCTHASTVCHIAAYTVRRHHRSRPLPPPRVPRRPASPAHPCPLGSLAQTPAPVASGSGAQLVLCAQVTAYQCRQVPKLVTA